jgi:hypothetical protein
MNAPRFVLLEGLDAAVGSRSAANISSTRLVVRKWRQYSLGKLQNNTMLSRRLSGTPYRRGP